MMPEPPSVPPRADLIAALAAAAEAWREPDHPRRAGAAAATLAEDNAFTEEAIAFAVNQQMSVLTAEALRAWAPEGTTSPVRVGVLGAGNVPFADLQDFVAVLVAGHAFVGAVSSKSPHLLPAFAEEVRAHLPALPASFTEAEALFGAVEAVIATGSDETRAWAEERCARAGIPPARRLLRGHRYTVAVLDGDETEDERERLAEDALLHEGFGCRNVAVVWAPEGLEPDPYFTAFADFRGVFPAHGSTAGRLKLQQAFLAAVDAPHASGEGLEFLISKGDPEPQPPGHVRWSEYADLDAVRAWLGAEHDALQLVVARPGLLAALGSAVPAEPLGDAQRPALDWCPDGVDTMRWLAGL